MSKATFLQRSRDRLNDKKTPSDVKARIKASIYYLEKDTYQKTKSTPLPCKNITEQYKAELIEKQNNTFKIKPTR